MTYKIVIGFLSTFLILLTPAYADNAHSTVVKVVDLLSATTSDTTLAETLSKRIDFEDMAAASTGDYWRKLSSGQKQELIQLIRQLVSAEYYPRWHKLFKTGKVTYTGDTVSNQDTYVKTTLTIGKKDSYVNWRLHAHDGEMQVLSLSVGKKDLLAKMQQRFQAKLQVAGFNGLISWLKEKRHNTGDSTGGSLEETTAELR